MSNTHEKDYLNEFDPVDTEPNMYAIIVGLITIFYALSKILNIHIVL